MVTTPSQRKKELRERLKAILKKLPDPWYPTFIHVFPEYAAEKLKDHLYNVGYGRSLDEAVISKMEELAKKLQTLKSK